MQIAKLLVSILVVVEAALAFGLILFAGMLTEAKFGKPEDGLLLLAGGVIVLHLIAAISLFCGSTAAKLLGGLCGAPMAFFASHFPVLVPIWIGFYGVLMLDWYSDDAGLDKANNQIGVGSTENDKRSEPSSEQPVHSI